MRRQPSITLRIALLFAVASSIIMLALGGFVGWSTDRHFEEIDAAELDSKLALIAYAVSEIRNPPSLGTLPNRLNDALVGHHGLTVNMLRADSTPIIAIGAAHFPDAVLSKPVNTNHITREILHAWEDQDNSYRGIVVTLPSANATLAPYQVALAVNINHHQVFNHAIQRTIWLAIGGGIALISLFAWLMTHRGLAPLRDIVKLVQDMSVEHLNTRLPVSSVPIELNDLAHSLNAMLSRLEEAFQRLSDFSSDIAHELRTPISNLLMQTQVALSKTRNAEEYSEVLYSNLEEYQRLATMIADMLFLAKADNGLMIPTRTAVDLHKEVEDLFTYYEALAEDLEVGLSVQRQGEGLGEVQGDRLMLRRAFSNLLSNAIRHTPRGGTVTVNIGRRYPGNIVVSVENPGEPIPPEHLSRLFDRFYRVDPSRQRVSEGAGLGLAITRSIVLSHGGKVQVFSDQTTRFEILLPADRATAPHPSR